MPKKSEEKREAILGAALEAFEASGFERARMEDIARRAGVAKGTLYIYFPEGKKSLLSGLADLCFETVRAHIREAEARPARTLREHMEWIARPMLEEGCNGRIARILRVIWREGLGQSDFTRRLIASVFSPIFDSPDRLKIFGLSEIEVPEVFRRYPQLLVAPIIQGILWQGLLGERLPYDTEEAFREYLAYVFPDPENEKGALLRRTP